MHMTDRHDADVTVVAALLSEGKVQQRRYLLRAICVLLAAIGLLIYYDMPRWMQGIIVAGVVVIVIHVVRTVIEMRAIKRFTKKLHGFTL